MTTRPSIRFDRAVFAILATSGAAAAGPVGCGGAPTAPQAPASSAAAAPALALPPAPDLSPVPPPPDLVVSGAIAKLGASLATINGWTQLPMPAADTVTKLLAEEDLGPIVDLDRPIYFAVTVAGAGAHLTPAVGVSAAVRDLEAAKATLGEHHKLVPGPNGALLIQHAGQRPRADGQSGDSSDEDEGRACEIAPAYGDGAFRLVCADDAKQLVALGPWLTRGATRGTGANDAHVDLRMQPLKATIAAERRLFGVLLGSMLGRPTSSSARDLAQAVAGDLVDFGLDLDTASLDLALSDPGAAATLTLRFSGSTSVLGRLLTANPDRNGPPPAGFWQMPGDTDLAVFDRGIDAGALARGRDLALKVVGDMLAEDGLKDADRHAVVDALGAIVTSAPVVYASGVDADGVSKAIAAAKGLSDRATPAEQSAAYLAQVRATLGWRIVEIDEPAAVKIDAMKALASALSRPGVLAVYHAKPGARVLTVRSSPMPPRSVLPKGTEHFAIDVPLTLDSISMSPGAKGAPASRPLGLDVFIVPDGARLWVGVGGDAALVAAKLAVSVSGSGDTLASKSELAAMKETAMGAGGFLTARATTELLAEQASVTGGPGDFENVATVLDGTPHQGQTLIPFSLTAPAAAPGTAVATLQVPRGTVEDLVTAVVKHGF
jgi:hypothetical protein